MLPVAVSETHSAAVIFFGDRAYKVKKPVDLGFLDFRSLEARQRVCAHEVELNRRLAPDVYLGVGQLLDPAGSSSEPLVVMRRMPDDRRLSFLVRTGAPVADHLRRLAHLMASFHASAATEPSLPDAGTRYSVRRNWEANTEQLRPFVDRVVDGAVVNRVATLAARFLDGRERLFSDRVAAGLVRDGHGDLLADDIFCLDDGPRVLDCIEFDDALRHGDVLADIAFLAMDLEHLGAPEAADRFLSWYDEFSGEVHPPALTDHYVAYRAQVRAKVSCLRHDQGVETAGESARHLLDLSLAHLERARVRLALVGGLPGTGKTTVAQALGGAPGWVVLSSDEVRKELAGLASTTPAAAPFGTGLYTQARTDATYAELLRRAREALVRGSSVVLDVSWSDARWRRRAASAAASTSSDLLALCCTLSEPEADVRLLQRATTGGGASDATPAVARAMAGHWDPWPEALPLTTTDPPEAVVRAATAMVQRPEGGPMTASSAPGRAGGPTAGRQR